MYLPYVVKAIAVKSNKYTTRRISKGDYSETATNSDGHTVATRWQTMNFCIWSVNVIIFWINTT